MSKTLWATSTVTNVVSGDFTCNAPYGCGVVFKLSRAGKYKVLYRFAGRADGGTPYAGLVRDAAGNLYGTAAGFGAGPYPGYGTVFKITTKLIFVAQPVGTTSPGQSIILTNYAAKTLFITGITTIGDFIQNNTCGSSLAAGASCTITVKFKPTQIGKRSGKLSIKDNTLGGLQSVALTGTGT